MGESLLDLCGRTLDLDKFLSRKRCVVRIKNKDNSCCARAIVTAIAHVGKDPKYSSYLNANKSKRSIQSREAEKLHKKAGIPLHTPCGINEIKKFQKVLKDDYQIVVVSKDYFNGIIYSGASVRGAKKIILFHHANHYDVITSMPAFLSRSYYCFKCQKGHNNKDHRCIYDCRSCFKDCGPKPRGRLKWVKCSDCLRSFKGERCFKKHKEIFAGASTCDNFHKCSICEQVFTLKRKPHQSEHICNEKLCYNCDDYVPHNHLCYIKTVGEGKEMGCDDSEGIGDSLDSFRYIFFDMECVQETGKHEPNLCISYTVCDVCVGEDITQTSFCRKCKENQHVFKGRDCKKDFCDWLFSSENNGSVCIAHNFKGYDGYFILQYLYTNNVLPEIIYNGSKIMYMYIKRVDMKFLDSFNYMPMALSKLPKAFSIENMVKGFWPYLLNTWENQDLVLPNLPEMHYYVPESMNTKTREEFLEWHNLNQSSTFDFKTEILKYCQDDVHILAKACLKFREIFMMCTVDENRDREHGIDPFQCSTTIASACNYVFRSIFLESDTVGVIPVGGYNTSATFSTFGLQWLHWVQFSKKLKLHFAGSDGEKKIGDKIVDGYAEINGEKHVYEAYGLWHGCPSCYSRKLQNPIHKKTMKQLHTETIKRESALRSIGYVLHTMWECSFKQKVKSNGALKSFLDNLEIVEPVKVRDPFFTDCIINVLLMKKYCTTISQVYTPTYVSIQQTLLGIQM